MHPWYLPLLLRQERVSRATRAWMDPSSRLPWLFSHLFPCGSIHPRPCPRGPTPVGFLLGRISRSPCDAPPSPGKRERCRTWTDEEGRSLHRGRKQRKAKKRRKKIENDPTCKRRMGRCSSEVDVRGRTKAKHEWKVPCDAHPVREGRRTSVHVRRRRGKRRRWHE